MPRNNRCILYQNSLETIANLAEGLRFLLAFLASWHLKSRLNIVSTTTTIHHKINLVLLTNQFLIFILFPNRFASFGIPNELDTHFCLLLSCSIENFCKNTTFFSINQKIWHFLSKYHNTSKVTCAAEPLIRTSCL